MLDVTTKARRRMDHEEAIRIQASEGYMLGDLTSSELEEFEEHFFTCSECSEDLQTGAIFSANARVVFREQSRRRTTISPAVSPQIGGSWWSWLLPQIARPQIALACAGAIVALACLAGYQNAVTIPRLKALDAPQAVLSFPLKIARGDDETIIPRGIRFFTLNFYLPQGGHAPGYSCTIENTAGNKVRTIPLATPSPGQPFTLLLRRSDFSSGAYAVKVYAPGSNTEIAIYRFQLQME